MAIPAGGIYYETSVDNSGLSRGMAQADGIVQGYASKIGASMNRILETAAGVSLANLGTQLLALPRQLATEALGAVASYEKLSLSLETLAAKEIRASDSSLSMEQALSQAKEAAKGTLEWVQQLAIKSPFTQEGVAQALRMAQAYGFTTDEAKRMTAAMIDFASGSGASEATMSRIAMVLGQIKAAGRLLGQDMMQLTTTGLPVVQILADYFHKTTAEIMALREKGLIPAKDAIEAITKYLEENFKGAAERTATSWSGLLSTISDLKQVGLREVFTGAFEAVQPYVAKFTDMLGSDAFRAKLREIGKIIGEDVANALKWASDNGDKLLVVAKDLLVIFAAIKAMEVWPSVAAGLAQVSGVLQTVGAGFQTLRSAMVVESILQWNQGVYGLANALASLRAGLAVVGEWFSTLVGGAMLTVGAIVGIVAAVALLDNHLQAEYSAELRNIDAIFNAAKSYQDYRQAMIDAGLAADVLSEKTYAAAKAQEDGAQRIIAARDLLHQYQQAETVYSNATYGVAQMQGAAGDIARQQQEAAHQYLLTTAETNREFADMAHNLKYITDQEWEATKAVYDRNTQLKDYKNSLTEIGERLQPTQADFKSFVDSLVSDAQRGMSGVVGAVTQLTGAALEQLKGRFAEFWTQTRAAVTQAGQPQYLGGPDEKATWDELGGLQTQYVEQTNRLVTLAHERQQALLQAKQQYDAQLRTLDTQRDAAQIAALNTAYQQQQAATNAYYDHQVTAETTQQDKLRTLLETKLEAAKQVWWNHYQDLLTQQGQLEQGGVSPLEMPKWTENQAEITALSQVLSALNGYLTETKTKAQEAGDAAAQSFTLADDKALGLSDRLAALISTAQNVADAWVAARTAIENVQNGGITDPNQQWVQDQLKQSEQAYIDHAANVAKIQAQMGQALADLDRETANKRAEYEREGNAKGLATLQTVHNQKRQAILTYWNGRLKVEQTSEKTSYDIAKEYARVTKEALTAKLKAVLDAQAAYMRNLTKTTVGGYMSMADAAMTFQAAQAGSIKEASDIQRQIAAIDAEFKAMEAKADAAARQAQADFNAWQAQSGSLGDALKDLGGDADQAGNSASHASTAMKDPIKEATDVVEDLAGMIGKAIEAFNTLAGYGGPEAGWEQGFAKLLEGTKKLVLMAAETTEQLRQTGFFNIEDAEKGTGPFSRLDTFAKVASSVASAFKSTADAIQGVLKVWDEIGPRYAAGGWEQPLRWLSNVMAMMRGLMAELLTQAGPLTKETTDFADALLKVIAPFKTVTDAVKVIYDLWGDLDRNWLTSTVGSRTGSSEVAPWQHMLDFLQSVLRAMKMGLEKLQAEYGNVPTTLTSYATQLNGLVAPFKTVTDALKALADLYAGTAASFSALTPGARTGVSEDTDWQRALNWLKATLRAMKMGLEKLQAEYGDIPGTLTVYAAQLTSLIAPYKAVADALKTFVDLYNVVERDWLQQTAGSRTGVSEDTDWQRIVNWLKATLRAMKQGLEKLQGAYGDAPDTLTRFAGQLTALIAPYKAAADALKVLFDLYKTVDAAWLRQTVGSRTGSSEDTSWQRVVNWLKATLRAFKQGLELLQTTYGDAPETLTAYAGRLTALIAPYKAAAEALTALFGLWSATDASFRQMTPGARTGEHEDTDWQRALNWLKATLRAMQQGLTKLRADYGDIPAELVRYAADLTAISAPYKAATDAFKALYDLWTKLDAPWLVQTVGSRTGSSEDTPWQRMLNVIKAFLRAMQQGLAKLLTEYGEVPAELTAFAADLTAISAPYKAAVEALGALFDLWTKLDAPWLVQTAGSRTGSSEDTPWQRMLNIIKAFLRALKQGLEKLQTEYGEVPEALVTFAARLAQIVAPYKAAIETFSTLYDLWTKLDAPWLVQTAGSRTGSSEDTPWQRMLNIIKAFLRAMQQGLEKLQAEYGDIPADLAAYADRLTQIVAPYKAAIETFTALFDLWTKLDPAWLKLTEGARTGTAADTPWQQMLNVVKAFMRAMKQGLEKLRKDYGDIPVELVQFAQDMTAIAGAFNAAIGALNALAAWRNVKTLDAKVTDFAAIWYTILTELETLRLRTQLVVSDALVRWTKAVGDIADGLSKAVNLLTQLEAWRHVTDIGAKIALLITAVDAVLEQLKPVAAKWDSQGLQIVSDLGQAIGNVMGGLQAALQLALAVPTKWARPSAGVWAAFFGWATGVFEDFVHQVDVWLEGEILGPGGQRGRPLLTDNGTIVGQVAGAFAAVMNGLQAALQLALAVPTKWARPSAGVWQPFFAWATGVFADFAQQVKTWSEGGISAFYDLSDGVPVLQETVTDALLGPDTAATVSAVAGAFSNVIGALSAALQLALADWDKLKLPDLETTMKGFVDWVGGVFGKVKDYIDAKWPAADAKTFEPVSAFGNAMSAVMGGLQSGLELLKGLVWFVTPAAENVDNFLAGVKLIMDKIRDGAAGVLTAAQSEAMQTFGSVMSTLFGSLQTALSLFEALGKFDADTSPQGKFAHHIQTFNEALLLAVNKWLTFLAEDFDPKAAQLVADFAPVIQKIADGFQSGLNLLGALNQAGVPSNERLKTFLSNLTLLFSDFTKNLKAIVDADDWQVLGKDMIGGLIAGVNAEKPKLLDAARTASYDAYLEVKKALGIASPSKVFASLGVQIPAGVVQGIAAGQAKLAGALRGMFAQYGAPDLQIDTRREAHIYLHADGDLSGLGAGGTNELMQGLADFLRLGGLRVAVA